jgi:hypothetical protein
MPIPENEFPPHDLPALVEALDRHGVDYLLVGGAAAFIYGATRLTEDADCVIRRERANLIRLADAMRELHARLRVGGMTDDEARQLPVKIDAPMLQGVNITTWMTDAGGFDILPGLAAEDGHIIPFEELATRGTVIPYNGVAVRLASLEDIITAKEHADRPKDHEALPELRALRDTCE